MTTLASFSIEQFCEAHGISIDLYFKLQRQGLGPKTMKVGTRTLISAEAAAEWRRARELAPKKKKANVISTALQIQTFFHCGQCMADKPDCISPQQWSRLDVGSTPIGWQVWCRRCDCNVVHVDFEGAVHPANLSRKAKASS